MNLIIVLIAIWALLSLSMALMLMRVIKWSKEDKVEASVQVKRTKIRLLSIWGSNITLGLGFVLIIMIFIEIF